MVQAFKFKPSGYLAALLIMVHLVAITVLIPLALPVWAKVAMTLVLAVNLAYLFVRDVLPGLPLSCVALSLGKGGVGLHTRNGDHLPCRVLQGSLVTPSITVVNVLPEGARFARSAIVLPDTLDGPSFRQLRVWLKWGG